jgi:hypothetical protein
MGGVQFFVLFLELLKHFLFPDKEEVFKDEVCGYFRDVDQCVEELFEEDAPCTFW